jgi:hypothetical protein
VWAVILNNQLGPSTLSLVRLSENNINNNIGKTQSQGNSDVAISGAKALNAYPLIDKNTNANIKISTNGNFLLMFRNFEPS